MICSRARCSAAYLFLIGSGAARRRGGRPAKLAHRDRRLSAGPACSAPWPASCWACATIRPTWSIGIGYDYDAIAAVLVGGTAIQGGQGSVIRTLAGRDPHQRSIQVAAAAARLSAGVAIPHRRPHRAVRHHASDRRTEAADDRALSGPPERSGTAALPVSGRRPSSCWSLLDWQRQALSEPARPRSVCLQTFATLGPVALGLGLTMLIREFDSVGRRPVRLGRLHRGSDRRRTSLARPDPGDRRRRVVRAWRRA